MKYKYPKGSKKLIRSWAFYDWANSVYSLVIVSSIFPIFYGALTLIKDSEGNVISNQVEFMGLSFKNDSLISFVTAAAFIVVAVFSPLLGGIADYLGNKKRFLQFFCYLGGLACIGLFWFDLDSLFFGLLCYFLAIIGFWASLVFYNSYLPEIAFKEQQDKASALGFSLGYIGSVILLILCLIMIEGHKWFGFASAELPTRLSFVLTGVWWMGFSQITYKNLPVPKSKKKFEKSTLLKGYQELSKIWQKLKADMILRRFLYAFFVYSMAVQTIMLVATYFGIEEINWAGANQTTGLIVSILLIQLIAIVGAEIMARMAMRFGNIRTLLVINVLWIIICAYAFTINTPTEFYITAGGVGLIMGGIQSLSRSTYSKLLPPNVVDTTSYFSFYDVTEKVGIVLGMMVYGYVSQAMGSIRYAVLLFISFFIGGVILLLRVPAK